MKTKFIQILCALFLLVTFAGYATMAADYASSKYEIVPVDNSEIENAEKAWTLSYGQETPVVIHLMKTSKGKAYIVRSKFFEVTYLLNEKGFGAKNTRSSMQEVSPVITRSVINDDQLEMQRVLSKNKLSEKEVLDIIASYLPDLINENYKHLLM